MVVFMKKLYILLTAFLLLFPLSGCTIEYSSVSTPETPKQEEETPIVSEPLIEENALFYPSTLNVTDPKITNYTYIFELNSLDNLDNFADVLSSINYDSYIYLTVKYNGKEVNISINKNNDKSFYLVELKKLD